MRESRWSEGQGESSNGDGSTVRSGLATRLCSYVVRHDKGLAPNPFWGYCTLAVCTPNHAGVRLEEKPVELDTLLLEVYRRARIMRTDVDIRLGHEDQAVVVGDADRLRQLFLNLVDNALKYTPPGGQVTLSLYREPEWVRVDISDTGIGIPEEDLRPGASGKPLIFERFYRSDPARTRGGGGTGLGLSIAEWIAHAHGGKLTVDSRLGEGSTFSVRLPVAP